MKFTSIAVKDFKELIRDRRGLFFHTVIPYILHDDIWFCIWGYGSGKYCP